MLKAQIPKDNLTLKTSLKYDPKEIDFSLQLYEGALLINNDKNQKSRPAIFTTKAHGSNKDYPEKL